MLYVSNFFELEYHKDGDLTLTLLQDNMYGDVHRHADWKTPSGRTRSRPMDPSPLVFKMQGVKSERVVATVKKLIDLHSDRLGDIKKLEEAMNAATPTNVSTSGRIDKSLVKELEKRAGGMTLSEVIQAMSDEVDAARSTVGTTAIPGSTESAASIDDTMERAASKWTEGTTEGAYDPSMEEDMIEAGIPSGLPPKIVYNLRPEDAKEVWHTDTNNEFRERRVKLGRVEWCIRDLYVNGWRPTIYQASGGTAVFYGQHVLSNCWMLLEDESEENTEAPEEEIEIDMSNVIREF